MSYTKPRWESLDKDREICHLRDCSLIRKKNNSAPLPLDCPVCKTMLRGIYDIESINNFQCCKLCADRWVYRDIDGWNSGYRPDIISINTELEERKKLPTFQIQLNEDI